MVYYKLGENASIFYDPTTRFLIRGKEVIAVKELPKSKKVNKAKLNGHIVPATRNEYLNYLGTTPPAEKETQETPEPEPTEPLVLKKYPEKPSKKLKAAVEGLKEKLTTLKEVAEYYRGTGWTDEDCDALLTLPADAPIEDILFTALTIDETYS